MATVEKLPAKTSSVVHDVLHGAHLECQEGAEFVNLVCGLVADWSEETFSRVKPKCPICWNAEHCPLCGAAILGSV